MSEACNGKPPLPPLPLPEGITSRMVHLVGIQPFHILEINALEEEEYDLPPFRRLVLLLHGFPGLAFSWCRIMTRLAAAGFYVVAPDMRGCGRTPAFRFLANGNGPTHYQEYTPRMAVNELKSLVYALRYRQTVCVVGHGTGAMIAGYCGLMDEEMFASVLFLNRPFVQIPRILERATLDEFTERHPVHQELRQLGSVHYALYFSSPRAAQHMQNPPRGLRNFLRGYYYLRSANNRLYQSVTIQQVSARAYRDFMPPFHILPLMRSMPQVVADINTVDNTTGEELTHAWLPDDDLDVYVSEYARTGFHDALRWFWYQVNPWDMVDMHPWAGVRSENSCGFLAGVGDWDITEDMGAIISMVRRRSAINCLYSRTVESARHWVHLEAPDSVVAAVQAVVGKYDDPYRPQSGVIR